LEINTGNEDVLEDTAYYGDGTKKRIIDLVLKRPELNRKEIFEMEHLEDSINET
jgi:hypothetical protein